MLLPTEPLITNPTWIVLVVLGLILFTPMVLERLKIPSIVGLIVAGMLVGPHGVHLLSRDASFEIFGKVGLYYIMFLASLGMNLTDVQRYRWGALAFGTISFVLPMALGFLANRWGLGLSFPAAVLVAAMYSGHTLLTYPLVMRWGLARHRSVGMAVGGTILTNVLTLVVYALALVRLGWPLGAHLCCDLSDLLLRDALNRNVGIVRNLEGNALGAGEHDGM